MRQRMATRESTRDRVADWVAVGLGAEIEADQMIALDLDVQSQENRDRLTRLVSR